MRMRIFYALLSVLLLLLLLLLYLVSSPTKSRKSLGEKKDSSSSSSSGWTWAARHVSPRAVELYAYGQQVTQRQVHSVRSLSHLIARAGWRKSFHNGHNSARIWNPSKMGKKGQKMDGQRRPTWMRQLEKKKKKEEDVYVYIAPVLMDLGIRSPPHLPKPNKKDCVMAPEDAAAADPGDSHLSQK